MRRDEDTCPGCGITRATLAREHAHYMLDARGRPETDRRYVAQRMADLKPALKPCPEACTCIPECFSMAEHEHDDAGGCAEPRPDR